MPQDTETIADAKEAISITDLDAMIAETGTAVLQATELRNLRKSALDEASRAWDAQFAESLMSAELVEEQQRAALHEALLALGIKTKQCGEWTAQDVVRNDIKVIAPALVRDSLAYAGKLDECLKFDLAAVKRVAKDWKVNGIETVANHSLRLTRSGE